MEYCGPILPDTVIEEETAAYFNKMSLEFDPILELTQKPEGERLRPPTYAAVAARIKCMKKQIGKVDRDIAHLLEIPYFHSFYDNFHVITLFPRPNF